MSDTIPRSFQIHVPDSALDDLRFRLERTRWPDEQAEVGWEQGIPLSTMRELSEYWADGFDWREQERRLNALDQIITVVDGSQLHAVHVRAADPEARALLLLHGWPSTFADYAGLVPRLRERYHVVIPSLPGFAFSGPTPAPGWNTRRMAGAMATLMEQLGYQRFLVHGDDTGASIGRWLAVDHGDRVGTLHSSGIADGVGPADDLTEDEQRRASGRAEYMARHSGYAIEQSQRPQTLSYGLTDSPVGQLAWVGEKLMSIWPDSKTPIARDAILTTVSIYWFTGTAASSARVYWEGARDGSWFAPPEYNPTPTAVAVFPNGLPGDLPIRRFAERVNNIVHWTEFERGGHFPALEVPDALLGDLFATFG